MRNHEEFVNEIYNRKETYLKEKKKTRKNIITFSIPFVLVAVLYSVMILPAMLPASKEDPNYDAHTTNEESTTAVSANSSPTTVAYTVSATEISPTGAPEAIKPTTVSPEIFVELDGAEYKSDDKITLSITDTANVGFGYSKFVDLWENNGGKWELKPNNHPKPAIAYEALPSNVKDEITVSFEIDLNEYEDLKAGTQYKLIIQIEGETYEALFTVTE